MLRHNSDRKRSDEGSRIRNGQPGGGPTYRAHEVDFLDLVQGEKQFQVPLYQRTFSWGEKQLAQLWRDLLAQSEAMSAGATKHTLHRLGGHRAKPNIAGRGCNRWLLVDGQQRLTALMLALAAIRDHVGDGEGDADRIHRQYLVNEFRQVMTISGCFPPKPTETRTGR